MMSAYDPEQDMQRISESLFDHLVGAQQGRFRDHQSGRIHGPEN
jgi:hypothetical protein